MKRKIFIICLLTGFFALSTAEPVSAVCNKIKCSDINSSWNNNSIYSKNAIYRENGLYYQSSDCSLLVDQKTYCTSEGMTGLECLSIYAGVCMKPPSSGNACPLLADLGACMGGTRCYNWLLTPDILGSAGASCSQLNGQCSSLSDLIFEGCPNDDLVFYTQSCGYEGICSIPKNQALNNCYNVCDQKQTPGQIALCRGVCDKLKEHLPDSTPTKKPDPVPTEAVYTPLQCNIQNGDCRGQCLSGQRSIGRCIAGELPGDQPTLCCKSGSNTDTPTPGPTSRIATPTPGPTSRIATPTPTPPQSGCAGSADLNCDSSVDWKDILEWRQLWSQQDTRADLDGNGFINILDMFVILKSM